jgi:methylated-DNA-[protein]-cysteine S-methyltransferase
MFMESVYYRYNGSPFGNLLLAGNDSGLKWILLPGEGGSRDPLPHWEHSSERFSDAVRQLEAYFAGKLTVFDLSLLPEGTPFQQSVWRELRTVLYGETISYGEIARRIGMPKAVRAVGAANGKNPLPIVIPCHRVIGSDGKLTGYGGGLPMKEFLLALERETLLHGIG